MVSIKTVLQIVGVTLLLAMPSTAAEWCGAEVSKSSLKSLRANNSSIELRSEKTSIKVPVYMHTAVSSTDGPQVLSEAVMHAQFNMLARSYAPYGISFTLQAIYRTVDDKLAQGWSTEKAAWQAYQARTRKGDYATLNVWFCSNGDPNSGGLSMFPWDHAPHDGCSINGQMVPGSTWMDHKMEGGAAVHEVGHWFGLLHTFADNLSCTGQNDLVDDTPNHRHRGYEDSFSCPVGKNTCPGVPGLDPTDNYMSYSFDGCWKRFTLGQKKRMFDQFYSLRSPGGKPPSVTTRNETNGAKYLEQVEGI